MLLGAIAGDFTGATDLANMLVRGWMRTAQLPGVRDGAAPDADAVVVALKSRNIAPRGEYVRRLTADEVADPRRKYPTP